MSASYLMFISNYVQFKVFIIGDSLNTILCNIHLNLAFIIVDSCHQLKVYLFGMKCHEVIKKIKFEWSQDNLLTSQS